MRPPGSAALSGATGQSHVIVEDSPIRPEEPSLPQDTPTKPGKRRKKVDFSVFDSDEDSYHESIPITHEVVFEGERISNKTKPIKVKMGE